MKKVISFILAFIVALSFPGGLGTVITDAAESPYGDFILAYKDDNGAYHVLKHEKGTLSVSEALDKISEETVDDSMIWNSNVTSGADEIYCTEDGTVFYLYITGDISAGQIGAALHEDGSSDTDLIFYNGWFYEGSYLQFSEIEKDIEYELKADGERVLPYQLDGSLLDVQLLLLGIGESKYGTTAGLDGAVYLAFGSDRHANTSAVSVAMDGMPAAVSYVGLLGDMAKQTESYNTSVILNEVLDYFGTETLDNSNVDIVYGSHDVNAVDDAGIMNNTNTDSDVSGLIYTGTDEDGNILYYVYGVSYDSMTDKTSGLAEAESSEFMTWIDENCENTEIPVFVVCHVPTHYKRRDNIGAEYWNIALNYAATGEKTTEAGSEIIRNVTFLSGHNHTIDTTLYNVKPEETYEIQGSEKDKTVSTVAYYSYLTDGYINREASGHPEPHSTLVEITENKIVFYQFPAASVESADVLQSVDRIGHTLGDTVKENIIDPGCTSNGSYDEVNYCDTCHRELSRTTVEVEATGHDWGNATYTWADDHSEVTAEHTCLKCGEKETESVKTVTEVTKEATIDENGEMTITASFSSEGFETQVMIISIPAVEAEESTSETESTSEQESTSETESTSEQESSSDKNSKSSQDWNSGSSGSEKSPKTADENEVAVWSILLFVSLFVIAGTFVAATSFRKKEN